MKNNKWLRYGEYLVGLYLVVDAVWELGEHFVKNKIVKQGLKVTDAAGKLVDVTKL